MQCIRRLGTYQNEIKVQMNIDEGGIQSKLKRAWQWPVTQHSRASFKSQSKSLSELFAATGAIAGTYIAYKSGGNFAAFLAVGSASTLAGHYVGAALSIPVHRLFHGETRDLSQSQTPPRFPR